MGKADDLVRSHGSTMTDSAAAGSIRFAPLRRVVRKLV